MHKNPVIFVCIPAFNEEATIGKIVLSAQKYVDRVLVCDDGSLDATSEIAEKCGAFVLRHERNMGKGMAITSLFRAVYKDGADIIVLLDGDGQHDPSEIPMLVKPIEQDQADLAVGSRYLNSGNHIPLKRKIGLKILDHLMKIIFKIRVNDTQCGFKAFSREALEAIVPLESKGYGVDSEILVLAAKNGVRVMEVPISVRYAKLAKTSKESFLIHGIELLIALLRLSISS